MASILTRVEAEQALSALADEFEQWRQHRQHRQERIPEGLWAQAMELTKVIPLTQVAKRLRLSGTDLGKRCRAQSATDPIAPGEWGPNFIELSWPVGQGEPASLVDIDIERQDGARMRWRCRCSAPMLTDVLKAFLEAKPCCN